jgi:D-alanyl-D-alanine carboxypeptidase
MQHQHASDLADHCRNWAENGATNFSIPGISFAIGHDAAGVEARTVGHCDREQLHPLDNTTQFEVASQTKMVTAMAMWILAERGSVDLYSPIATHLPEFQHLTGNTTVFDFLVHRSGLPRDFYAYETGMTLLSAVDATVAHTGPNPKPAYSNLAFSLLAEVIARVSGETYEEFVRREILEALQLDNTSWYFDNTPNRSKEYEQLIDASRVEATPLEHRFSGALGLWSTPSDMCKLVRAYLGSAPNVLNEQARLTSTAMQWGPTPATGGREFGVALEVLWMAGRRWIGHSGGGAGFLSATYFCVDTGDVFSLALNARTHWVLEQFVEAIATGIETFNVPADPNRPDFSPVTGSYQGSFGRIDIFTTPSRCLLVDPCDWNPLRNAYQVIPDGNGQFKIVGPDFNVVNMPVEIDGDTLRFGIHAYKRI